MASALRLRNPLAILRARSMACQKTERIESSHTVSFRQQRRHINSHHERNSCWIWASSSCANKRHLSHTACRICEYCTALLTECPPGSRCFLYNKNHHIPPKELFTCYYILLFPSTVKIQKSVRLGVLFDLSRDSYPINDNKKSNIYNIVVSTDKEWRNDMSNFLLLYHTTHTVQ